MKQTDQERLEDFEANLTQLYAGLQQLREDHRTLLERIAFIIPICQNCGTPIGQTSPKMITGNQTENERPPFE